MSLASFEKGEAPMRRRWRMKQGAEVKKQGAMLTLQGKQCDCVSEGVTTAFSRDGGLIKIKGDFLGTKKTSPK